MIKTRILRQREWGIVEPIVRGVFRDGMPTNPEQSTYLAALDGETLAGFLHIERLFHINCLYIAPEFQKTQLPWEMMKQADAGFQKQRGSSAIVLTDMNGVGNLVKRLGATDRGVWTLLRKDYS